MKPSDLKKKYFEFFREKGHKVVHSAPLVPEHDPTVLFTTAGMHPLVPYLMGEPHPLGKRLADVQKCLRTDDIEEVGDNCHHTFFFMLGNWSLGDYFKERYNSIGLGLTYSLIGAVGMMAFIAVGFNAMAKTIAAALLIKGTRGDFRGMGVDRDRRHALYRRQVAQVRAIGDLVDREILIEGKQRGRDNAVRNVFAVTWHSTSPKRSG